MTGKIVVTSSYPELSCKVREIAKQLQMDILLIEAVLEDAVDQVEALLEKQMIDVLVSRGGTAELLKKKFALPLIDMDPSPFDILQALAKAKELSVNLAYFAYPEITDATFVNQSEGILGIPIPYYPYHNLAELTAQITRAQQEGCEVIVGGGHRGVRLATAYGMEGFLIYSSSSTVTRALKQAREISSLKQSERDKGEKQRKTILSKGFVAHYTFADLIGTSLKEVIEKAKLFSQTEATILIRGESGTGKELFAQSIHSFSSRRSGPFVAVNCAALPENLLESELFGYEEGAFTGAKKGGKTGLFELAQGGTLFLDEIGKMSSALQARLLRALQSKEIRKIGGESLVPVNVRILAASNEDLQSAVEQGTFRADLYYRLNVLALFLPPLRERPRDIHEIAEAFLTQLESGHDKNIEFSSRFIELLRFYPWPGNVRELENIIRRYAVLSGGETSLPLEDLLPFFPELHSAYQAWGAYETQMSQRPALPINPKNFLCLIRPDDHKISLEDKSPAPDDHFTEPLTLLPSTLEDMEEQLIHTLLERCQGNRSLLASKLGISRTTLWKRLNSNDLKGLL